MQSALSQPLPADSAVPVTETARFLDCGDERLFTMLHEPAVGATRTAFVMSHPFAEEKLWSHRVFVSFARQLAGRGHPVLRFDYRGAGDSSGATPDTSLATHIADITACISDLRKRLPNVERVGLIGLRLGASVAALVAEQAVTDESLASLRHAPLVLWDPVMDGESYFQEVLRSNLTTQLAVYGKVRETRDALLERIRAGGTVNVDGYDIGQSLIESFGRTDLLKRDGLRHAGPALVVQIAATEQQKVREDLQDLARGFAGGEFARVAEQPFWREIKPFYGRAQRLQQSTLSWLENAHA